MSCVLGVALGMACSAGSEGDDPGPGANDAGGTTAQAGSATGGAAAGASSGGSQVSGGGGAGAGTAGGATSGGTSGSAGSGSDGGAGGRAPELGRPNILVVLLDDMGYSDLGSYGGEIRTPVIDALAKGGTRFRNFHVTPRCSPTRISLMTGLYTQQGSAPENVLQSLPPLRTDNNVTLPEMLSAAGYRTYMAGKWHLGMQDGQPPRSRGFDHVFGFGPKAAGAEANKWKKEEYTLLSEGNAIAERKYGDAPGDFYQARAMADYAIDYLKYHEAQNDEAPFFMYMAFNAPHFPVQAPRALVENAPAGGGSSYLSLYGQGWNSLRTQRYQRMLTQGVIDETFLLSPREPFMTPEQNIPDWGTLSAAQKADSTRKMATYAASIESVDTNLGRVVAQLKQQGKFENTVIFVLSDNGGNYEGGVVGTMFGKPDVVTGAQLENMGQPEQPNDHMQVGGGWANVETTPFRFYKHYTHGGGVRSPLVVSWPAKTAKPGAWTNQVGHVMDLAPTILAAAGATQPAMFGGHAVLPLEGTSLEPAITEGDAIVPRQLGFEHEQNRAWIDGNFKLVVRHENADQPELYDLSKDPTELNDLAQKMPAKLKTMIVAWNSWAKHVGLPEKLLLKVPN